MATGTSDGRNDVIDAFRGVAILSVMAFHYLVRWEQQNLYGYHQQFPQLLAVGHLGVQLFFVISGLVITMTVLRSRDALDFGARRFARLYPAFIVGVALTFLVTSFASIPQFKTGLTDVFANLTMDAPELHRKMIDGAYWSLSVEIKFYAIVGLFFAVFGNRFWMAIMAFALAGAALAHLAGTARAERVMIADFMPFFLLGIGLWFLIFDKQQLPGATLVALGIALYLFFASNYVVAGASLWADHVYLGVAVGLLFFLLRWVPELSFGPLASLGRISYSLYLIHQDIGVILIRWLVAADVPDIVAAASAAAICIAIAALMSRTVEGPGRRLVMRTFADIRRSLDRQGQTAELRS